MALSGAVSIPVIQPLLDKLDGMKAKFLAVPANTRMALDRLARIRQVMVQNGSMNGATADSAQVVENNLKRVQAQWDTAAASFSALDDLRRNQKTVSLDAVQMASSLALSASFVIRNADSSVQAVESFAAKYLTPDQQKALDVQTLGASNKISAVMLLGMLAGGYVLARTFRRR